MRRRSAMGSSKYEFEPYKLDRDFNDREVFFGELKNKWILKTGSPKDIYEKLISLDSFDEALNLYRRAGYEFRFTYEGYCDRVLTFCTEPEHTGAAGVRGCATNDLKRDATQTQSGS